VSGNSQMC